MGESRNAREVKGIEGAFNLSFMHGNAGLRPHAPRNSGGMAIMATASVKDS